VGHQPHRNGLTLYEKLFVALAVVAAILWSWPSWKRLERSKGRGHWPRWRAYHFREPRREQEAARRARAGVWLTTASEQGAELSDVELLRRAVTCSRPVGSRYREMARGGHAIRRRFGVAQSLCKLFGVDPMKGWHDDRR
jgi:hypothetical protein